MVRFRCKPCPGRETASGEDAKPSIGRAIIPAGECGGKDQVSRTGAQPPAPRGRRSRPMELTCTGRGIHVTEEMRASATRKLARVERFEARATRLEVEIIVEKNPRRAHLKRLEAALHTPR